MCSRLISTLAVNGSRHTLTLAGTASLTTICPGKFPVVVTSSLITALFRLVGLFWILDKQIPGSRLVVMSGWNLWQPTNSSLINNNTYYNHKNQQKQLTTAKKLFVRLREIPGTHRREAPTQPTNGRWRRCRPRSYQAASTERVAQSVTIENCSRTQFPWRGELSTFPCFIFKAHPPSSSRSTEFSYLSTPPDNINPN